MVKKQQIQQPSKSISSISELEQFSLGFEYDKTIQEVRREVRIRTYKNA